MYWNYAPVVAFKLEQEGEVLAGYAAAQSDAPCLVKLMAGDTVIACVRACGYSDLADQDGFRSGWCGFEMPGVAQAFALSDAVHLVCGVSNKELCAIAALPAAQPSAAADVLSVADMLAEVRRPESCPTLEHLLPFAMNHYRRHGVRPFVEATYQTLLGRWPDAAAVQINERPASEEKRVLTYLKLIIKSNEYNSRWGTIIPGPWHPGFRYDRTGLI